MISVAGAMIQKFITYAYGENSAVALEDRLIFLLIGFISAAAVAACSFSGVAIFILATGNWH
jgi:hypothetical protein